MNFSTGSGPRAPLTLVVLLWGCGGAAEQVPAVVPSPPRQTRVELPRMVVTPERVTSIDALHAQASLDFDAGRFPSAARGFARVFELDPTGPLAPEALFQSGTAYDLAGEPRAALQGYEAFSSRFPRLGHARAALLRSARLYGYFEQWERAGRTADLVAARYQDLRPFELITLHGAKALSLVAIGDDTNASYYVEKARTLIEENQFDAAGQIPRDLAQVYYALGEIRRLRAERIKFVPVPDNFAEVLEARCQLLLDAQSSYSDTMRAHDAHWSAMAGYRVGELYQRLHEDLMQVPPPSAATTPSRKLLFEGAMRLRYSILLEKAESMLKHTLAMAERSQERSVWVGKAQSALLSLQEAMDREQAALDALPYSRDELRRALDELGSGQRAANP